MFLACIESRHWQDACCPHAPIGCSSTPCSEKPPAHAPSASLKCCECVVCCGIYMSASCARMGYTSLMWIRDLYRDCQPGYRVQGQTLSPLLVRRRGPVLSPLLAPLPDAVTWVALCSLGWSPHTLLPFNASWRRLCTSPGAVVVERAGSLREGSCPPCKQPGGLQGPACCRVPFALCGASCCSPSAVGPVGAGGEAN